MSTRRLGESKALVLVRTADGGAKYIEAPPQEVVEEEAYNESIGSILDRDFFPELPKLRAYNEWLDARASGHFAKMAQVREKWLRSGTLRLSWFDAIPFSIPASHGELLTSPPRHSDQKKRSYSSMDTPIGISRAMAEETPDLILKRRKLVDVNGSAIHQEEENELTKDAKTMSLDAFLSKYTSEDNNSFSKLLERNIDAARRAYKEAFDRATEEREKLMEQGKLIGWKDKKHDPAHVGVLTYPTGVSRIMTAEDFKSGEKAVVPENTRFPEGGPSWKHEKGENSNLGSSTDPNGAASSFGGHNIMGAISGESSLDAQLYARILQERKAAEEGIAIFENEDSDAPTVAGYRLVSTPKIHSNNVDQSPRLTWGEKEDTVRMKDLGFPVASSASAENLPSHTGFSVPAISKRTISAHKNIKKRAPTPNMAQSPLLQARAAAMKTPLFQMTPDLQLRSSYAATPRLKSSSALSTPSGFRSGTSTPVMKTPVRK